MKRVIHFYKEKFDLLLPFITKGHFLENFKGDITTE